MNIASLKGLTLSELDKANSTSIWVINMTGNIGIVGAEGKAGRINLSVNDGMGNTIPVQIPLTWIPVDLTTQATKASLVANPQFRRLSSSGAIKLLAEDDAVKILADPDAQREAKRIYSLDSNIELKMPAELKDQLAVQHGTISPAVISVVQRDDLDEESALSSIKANQMALSREDYEYLAANCKHSKVKEWAIDKIV